MAQLGPHIDSPLTDSSIDDGGRAVVRGLCKTFAREGGGVVRALDGVSFSLAPGRVTALVGPDGAGKTTLMRILAGLLGPGRGTVRVLGLDPAQEPQAVQERISYMPQKFGLYEDLTVQENLDLYADVHGIPPPRREERYAELLAMTELAPFRKRLAGQLSGGMKQKLGLACSLLRLPELLLLDEPTVGVDPLSRRELWQIIQRLAHGEGLAVLMSTAYMDEAARCGSVLLLHEGKLLAQGSPQELLALAPCQSFQAVPAAGDNARHLQRRLAALPGCVDALPQAGSVRFVLPGNASRPAALPALPEDALQGAALRPTDQNLEDSFMALLRAKTASETQEPQQSSATAGATSGAALGTTLAAVSAAAPGAAPAVTSPARGEPIIEVRNLVRRFGAFTAVDNVSFSVGRGEVFGLLGPNGAGKTTTFRMLCGLLPATSGSLSVAGVDVRNARESARQRLGYVAQKFSLYGPLSVRENLEFFAGAYGLRGERLEKRIDAMSREFNLGGVMRKPAGQLPGGYKQRLSMAAAMLHEPEILFLDEPTSGADPLARREFWRRIGLLADGGVTVVVTTHFMEEAEYCDRILIQDHGRMLALGTPEAVRREASGNGAALSMEEAFIAVVQKAREAA